jgi:aminocarboxymuconate-semialdehyde decarboxylase
MPESVASALERDPARFGSTVEIVDGEKWLFIQGRRYGRVNADDFDISRRLADMDSADIDVQVLSPRPFLLSYASDPQSGAELAAEMNEGLAALMRASDRIWAVGQLPLQSIELSLKELEHVRELGLCGIAIGGSIDGVELDDESLEPIWTRLDELDTTVFVHPLNKGFVPRMDAYQLSNIVGNPLDTSLGLSRLLLGGVLARHPRIRFYFAHGGGFMPYLFGRVDQLHRVREGATEGDVPSSFLSGCYFDTLTYADKSLSYLVDLVGDDRVVVGTDYPADITDWKIAERLACLDLSNEARSRIEHENAERLFGKTVAPSESAV